KRFRERGRCSVRADGDGRVARKRRVAWISRPSLTAPVNAVFKGGELVDADRAASMQASRGNADLRAEAEFPAIGELSGCVMQHDGGVDFTQECVRCRLVIGDDSVGVMRAIMLDMRDCGGEIVHYFH